ncbi:MAG: iron chaperone [Candidatus Saccharimonadia bacterium]
MSIEDYLSNLKPEELIEFERIRAIVKELAPEATERISYKLPTFFVQNKPLVYFAAFPNHLSLFPTSRPIAVLKDKLTGYKLSRGTIRYSLDNLIPDELIRNLLQVRLEDIYKS